jgi:DNA-binding XRE family transcriptional regulator
MHIHNESEVDLWRRAVVQVIAGTRNDNDLSQREVAYQLHVSRNTIANIETGHREVYAPELPLIAVAIGTRPEILYQRILMWRNTMK